MSAGDILLFHRPTTLGGIARDPMGGVMCALIHLTTRSRWNHAALDIGDDKMVEATSKGVTVSPIASSDEIRRVRAFIDFNPDVACHPGTFTDNQYVGNDLEDVLAWSTGRVGWRYGYLNAFMCGLRSLIPGLQLKRGKTIICSELVAEALERAGHDFGKDSALVSPGDLASHFGVGR